MADRITRPQAVLIAAVRRAAKSGSCKATRIEAGLSLQDIGDACGVAASSVMRWEAGRVPRAAAALRWAAILADLQKVIQP